MSDLSSSASDYSSQGGSQEVMTGVDSKRRKSLNGTHKPTTAGPKSRQATGNKMNGSEKNATRPKTATASTKNNNAINISRHRKAVHVSAPSGKIIVNSF